METEEIVRARRETPGCEHRLHFNNAGAALMPSPVIEAQRGHLDLEARIGGYEAAEERAEAIEETYAVLARLVGCQPSEIALVENATVAWQVAFHSFDWKPGDRVITTRAAYASNYISYLHQGLQVEALPNDGYGQVCLEALEQALKRPARLVALTHVPTNGGLVNPAAEVGRLARQAGVPFLLDACQSVGQLQLDVDELGCDLLSATSRKFLRGPRGVGFLYVRESILERLRPPMLDLHSARWTAPDRYELRGDARRFENWERNYSAVLGLRAAAEYAMGWGMGRVESRVGQLADSLREGLLEQPGIEVHDLGARRCGIVTFTLAGREPGWIKARLQEAGINTSVSTCFSTRLDMIARGLEAVVRASPHYYNTEAEIERFCAEIKLLKP